jgi:hypothetical protein
VSCLEGQVSPGAEAMGKVRVKSCEFNLEKIDRNELLAIGSILDHCPDSLNGHNVAMHVIERLLRVRTRDGSIVPLRANAVQAAFEARRGQRNIVLKARQLGLTTWTAARFFLRTITRPGTLTLEVAHTQDAAEEIFRIVRRFYDWLPEEWREGLLRTTRANARQLVFPELESQYRVESAGDRNAGRGLTVQNLHCSELARWPGDAAETLAGLRATLAPDAEVVLESTPEGVGGCFHEEWMQAPLTGMVRHFFPWWMEERYRGEAVDAATLTEEEQKLMARHALTLEQVGFRRQIRANFRGLARQEYAEDADGCFLASGESIFDIAAMDARLREMWDAPETGCNGQLEVWFPPQGEKQYLVAVDPAGGGCDGDNSAMEVLDMETGMECAEFAGHVGGLELARLISEVANRYNHAWVVVERNNHGSGVLAYLESLCGYGRIYKKDGQAGWLTTSVSRPAALNRLAVALSETPQIFFSRRLLAECRGFVRLPNGGSGARAGAHDDRVMAMAIGLAARAEMLEKRMVGNDGGELASAERM